MYFIFDRIFYERILSVYDTQKNHLCFTYVFFLNVKKLFFNYIYYENTAFSLTSKTIVWRVRFNIGALAHSAY